MSRPRAPVSWAEFRSEVPALAARAEAIFAKTGVLLVGTVRRDGSPRISPVESLIAEGELWLGMMSRSLKAADLSRDRRCTVHSAIVDRYGMPGEFKAHGAAVEVSNPEEYAAYGAALEAKIGWHPGSGGYPLYTFRLDSAALFDTGSESRTVTRWRIGRPIETFEQGP